LDILEATRATSEADAERTRNTNLTPARSGLFKLGFDGREYLPNGGSFNPCAIENINAILNKIQLDEIKSTKGRGKKRTIEEVQATLPAEELERKDKNKARIESARKEAAADRDRQTLMLEVLKESVKTLKFTNMFMARPHLDVFPTQPFNSQNTWDNVASADCDE
jgi:hypothetical protein